MLLLSWLCLVAMPFAVLMPVFADRILGGGPYTLGFLMTASGVGALSGALWLTTRKSVIGLGRVILLHTTVFGVGLIGFAFSRWLWLSLIFLVVIGVGMMVQMASTNTVIQTIVDDEKRGRVMSFYTMAFLGTAPFGSLLAGGCRQNRGAATVALGGILCWSQAWPKNCHIRALRPIIRMGILPEVLGIQSAANPMVPPEQKLGGEARMDRRPARGR
jgi:MFS family permease